MSKPLPPRPDLRHLRDEAKRRKRDGEFQTLALAQFAIAREYGFRSWPRLKAQVDALTLDAVSRAEILIRSALSADTRRAVTLLELDPALGAHDIACACVSGDPRRVAALLARDAGAATEPTGPLGHAPIVYATFSRLLRDPERAAGIRSVVRLLLDAGADPNASFMHGDWLQVPLYGAAGIAGDAELTAMLTSAGADPNDAGKTHTVGEALYHACELPEPTCARLLIEAGTDPDVAEYCLGRVLNFDRPEMVEMFCGHGVRPRGQHLHQALWRRRPVRTLRALLDAGAPVDEPDHHGLTALQIAQLWGDEASAALLRERGARSGSAVADLPLSQRDEMVILAVQGGHLETLRRLLDTGARVDGDPDSEDDPLGQACWRGRVEIVRELLNRGAGTEFKDGGCAIGAALHGSRHCQDPEGGPTMQTTAEIDPEPYARIVRMLLDAGARIPARVGGEHGPQAINLMADLGIDPPQG